MALKGEWQVSLPSFSPLPSRLTALWQSRGPNLGYSSSLPSSAPLSPQLPSFCLNLKVVRLEKNISRLMARSVMRILSGTFQQLSCFPPRYKHFEVALSLNIGIQKPQQCWTVFCECVIQQPTIYAFYSASYCLFVLPSSFSTFNDTSTVQKQQNVSLLTQYFPTCFVFPCLKTCWQTSFRFKHLAVSLCCSAKSWCSHFFLQGLEGPTVSVVSFEPTLPPVVSSSETQWWCPWLLCRPLYLWPEASWNGFGSH